MYILLRLLETLRLLSIKLTRPPR